MALGSDLVEREILKLVVDREDGLQWRLASICNAISTDVKNPSHAEVVDALLSMHESKLVKISRYEGSVFVPYDPEFGTDFFHDGDFRCAAAHRARRRLEELSEGAQTGIFISHIVEQEPLASQLQNLFEKALSPTVEVFVSSDYKSIPAGEQWYEMILQGLRRSRVILVLLSPNSLGRPWINFEAGVGIGQGSRVVPVVVHGLKKSEIGLPLGQLQARTLDDEKDFHALVQGIASLLSVSVNDAALPDLLEKVRTLKLESPSK